MTQSLTDRYDDRIAGVLSCYDRMVITGTLPGVCYADGMTRYLNAKGIRIFDYPQFAMELRMKPPTYRIGTFCDTAETTGAITRSMNRDSRNKNSPTLFLAPPKYRSCHPSTAGTAIDPKRKFPRPLLCHIEA
jgi:hypothetical protein